MGKGFDVICVQCGFRIPLIHVGNITNVLLLYWELYCNFIFEFEENEGKRYEKRKKTRERVRKHRDKKD